MADKENDLLILTLLLINKGEPLNNSYKITRILEWQFHFIDTKKILDKIKNHYAQYDILNGVHHYKLTKSGKNLIKEKYSSTLESLIKEYPKEQEIIRSLFASFS